MPVSSIPSPQRSIATRPAALRPAALRPAALRPAALRPAVLAVAALGLALSLGTAHAGSTTGFAFLNLPAGARYAALGGTGVATASGPLALFWNPAGLAPDPAAADGSTPAGAGTGRVVADHNESILSFRQELVGGQMIRGRQGAGLALNAHYTEGIDQRDALGNLTGSFGVTDLAAALGVAGEAAPGLRLGGGIDWVREDIGGSAASAFGISVGGIYDVPRVKGLALGAAIKNLGKSPAFKTDTGADGAAVEQPLTLTAGASYGAGMGHVRFRAAADAVKLRGDSAEGRLGLEVAPTPALALRGGWMLGQDAADLTAGLGVTVGRFRIDYAFVPYHENLGASHSAALEAAF
jgi:hypothetical protein